MGVRDDRGENGGASGLLGESLSSGKLRVDRSQFTSMFSSASRSKDNVVGSDTENLVSICVDES